MSVGEYMEDEVDGKAVADCKDCWWRVQGKEPDKVEEVAREHMLSEQHVVVVETQRMTEYVSKEELQEILEKLLKDGHHHKTILAIRRQLNALKTISLPVIES